MGRKESNKQTNKQKGLVPVASENMRRKYWLTCLGKCVVRLTDRPAMTIAVDWDIKLQAKQTIDS